MNPIFRRLRALAAPTKPPVSKPPTERDVVHALPAPTISRVRASLTVDRIASVIGASENGDSTQLLALYRDVLAADDHIQCEFGKRLAAVLGDALQVIPFDKQDSADVRAAEAVRLMINHCTNWQAAISHLMKSALWPVTVALKIFTPAPSKSGLRFILHALEPVDFEQIDLKPRPPSETRGLWEGNVRLCTIRDDGWIERANPQPIDPEGYVVHRGNLLGLPDAWGGTFRSVLFWWLLGNMDRDWWARFLEKFGQPFLHGKTDTSQPGNLSLLQSAFALASRLGGLVTDRETEVEIKEAAIGSSVDAFERFHDYAARRISRAIVGQDLSGSSAPTGLGSGTAKLQGNVRDDLRQCDQSLLNSTLGAQLLRQFLALNGIPGRVPKLVWGGQDEDKAGLTGALLNALATAGLEPDDEALPVLSEKVGFTLRRKAAPEMAPPQMPRALSAGESQAVRGRLATFAAQAQIAGAIGVPASWLNPVRERLRALQTAVGDSTLSDAELMRFIDEMVEDMPELLDTMDVDALADVLEAGMGQGALSGVRAALHNREKTSAVVQAVSDRTPEP